MARVLDLDHLTLDQLDELTTEQLDALTASQLAAIAASVYPGGPPPAAGQGGLAMSSYVVPQVQVFQEIELVPAADVRPLPAHVAGGHAQLLRFAEADEKESGSLGVYDPLANDEASGGKIYLFPDRPAGGVVDDGYTKVYVEDALLRYYEHQASDLADIVATVAGKLDQVRAGVTNWVDNGTDYPRAAALLERDVQVGDICKIRAVVGETAYELCTYVSGFVADEVGAEVASPAADDANEGYVPTTAATYSRTGGDSNCVDISAASGTGYSGWASGHMTETYTVTVLKGSVGGDATTAELRVTSASGDDPAVTINPSAFGESTAIGSRGLLATWDNILGDECSLSAAEEAVSAVDFVRGQTWEITVCQAYTPTLAESTGSYDGAEDAVVIVEVTKGGAWASRPEITVTTDRGTDASGPTRVTAEGVSVAAGTQGVLVTFTGDGLVLGDRWYISCQAAGEGDIRTIRLGHNLPQEVLDNGATEVDLSLYIRKTISVPAQEMLRLEDGTLARVNWTQNDTQLVLMGGLYAYDASWTSEGLPVGLPVVDDCDNYSHVYVECRYWLADLCSGVTSINDVAQLDTTISGVLHPDNPLKWGVFKALQNSGGTPVAFTSVCDPSDTDAWLRVLEFLDGRTDVYHLVPLTRDEVVWSLYQAHCDAQSAPEIGRWRVAWFNHDGVPEKVVVNATKSADGAEVLAVLEDDPTALGTQYTQLRVPAGNGRFLTNEVAAGDIVRFLYTTDGFDTASYTEFVVDEVVNEDTIRLLHGADRAYTQPQKIEIWRALGATAEAVELARTAGFADKRVRMVWPDEVGQDGYTVPGYFLCCCLAGLASGVVPQQGLTRLEISGCDDVSRTTAHFNRAQQDIMAAGGVWIVTQDATTGMIHTRHAVTTAAADRTLAEKEEMVVRNLDSISYYTLNLFNPYIGISNVTPGTIAMLRAEVNGALKYLASANQVQRLGGQIITGSIRTLRRHASFLDRIVVAVNLTLPMPLNELECHLIVVS